ncbi:hypothetical protein JQ310_19285, partial [Leptospira interrogans]|nr:hypothetical protein [Leptospira interrogans]
NYLQNRVNGRMDASFGEYFMNKVEMGDIRPGTGQTKGLVWDNGYLKGYDDQYPPKGQDGSKTLIPFYRNLRLNLLKKKRRF